MGIRKIILAFGLFGFAVLSLGCYQYYGHGYSAGYYNYGYRPSGNYYGYGYGDHHYRNDYYHGEKHRYQKDEGHGHGFNDSQNYYRYNR